MDFLHGPNGVYALTLVLLPILHPYNIGSVNVSVLTVLFEGHSRYNDVNQIAMQPHLKPRPSSLLLHEVITLQFNY